MMGKYVEGGKTKADVYFLLTGAEDHLHVNIALEVAAWCLEGRPGQTGLPWKVVAESWGLK